MRLRDMNDFTRRVHINMILYSVTIMLLKVAILVDWDHLFNPLKKRNIMFWAIPILLAANVICYMIAIFFQAFRCTPERKIWDVFYRGGHCFINSINSMNIVTSVVNVVSDFAILCLPQWVIWRLKMTRAAKAGVSVLFLIGILAVVCAFCRMAWLTKFMADTREVTYLAPIAGAFSLGETTAAFLIIGVPSVPKVFNKLSSQCLSIRSMWAKIGLSSWSGRRQTRGRVDDASRSGGRTPNQPIWRSPVHHQALGAWEVGDSDTFDLLYASAARLEADRYPAHAVDVPQSSIKRQMSIDVVNERIG
ncbi:hypothetical protein KVR01_012056 [Diaporthe batatas]|uniref:uncharacterized protein n=1 Tax=Diaporthe batatas TaxID=748121 RepID=UPI001D03B1AC|nr:uncharacterized protein KVR01_012056 [Diaporthe batatas]KAG8158295.1 hypothetical protein KVR01_012056 [Diaporthe batatas]